MSARIPCWRCEGTGAYGILDEPCWACDASGLITVNEGDRIVIQPMRMAETELSFATLEVARASDTEITVIVPRTQGHPDTVRILPGQVRRVMERREGR